MKPRQQLLALVMLHSAVSLSRSDSKISISADGGYSNIVIKLDTKVNPLHCALYVERISVRFLDLCTSNSNLNSSQVYPSFFSMHLCPLSRAR